MKPGVAHLTFVVIVLGLSGVVNISEDALTFLYIDRSSLVMTLAALIISGLIVYRNLLFATLVAGLTFTVCQPPEICALLPLNVDVLGKTLAALTFAPLYAALMGPNSNTRPAVP